MTPKNDEEPNICRHPSCYYSHQSLPHTKAECACVIDCCHQKKNDWRERFDVLVAKTAKASYYGHTAFTPSWVKDFIQSERLALAKEMAEAVLPEVEKYLWHWKIYEEDKEGITKKAQEAPQIADGSECSYVWNTCRTEVQNRIDKFIETL